MKIFIENHAILLSILTIVAFFIFIIIWGFLSARDLNERQEKSQNEIDEKIFKN